MRERVGCLGKGRSSTGVDTRVRFALSSERRVCLMVPKVLRVRPVEFSSSAVDSPSLPPELERSHSGAVSPL